MLLKDRKKQQYYENKIYVLVDIDLACSHSKAFIYAGMSDICSYPGVLTKSS